MDLPIARGLTVFFCAWAALGLHAAPLKDSFEDGELRWNIVAGDAPYRLDAHQNVKDPTRDDSGCEHFRIDAGTGTHVYVGYELSKARVVDELTPGLTIKSDRRNLQLLARVVFPRSLEPNTDRPVTALIRGSFYTEPGTWQTLTVANVPLLVSRQIRVLRSMLKSDVDPREAYIDMLILNVYGGSGRTNVWIDDLHVAGYIPEKPEKEETEEAVIKQVSGVLPQWNDTANATAPVYLQGNVMIADGRPFFPRIIEHRGESLAFLKSLGFNTIHLAAPPTDTQLEHARTQGLWFVCPPPDLSSPVDHQKYDRVLCWHMGLGWANSHLPNMRRWAETLQRWEGSQSRPVLCGADSALRDYSRAANVLLLDRPVLGTTFELRDYGHWLRTRPWLARPGTPLWTTIHTQLPDDVLRQLVALSQGSGVDVGVQYESLRLQTFAAVASAIRGIEFRSATPLDAPDEASRLRAAALELINLELSVIEPWSAGGGMSTGATSSHPNVQVTVLTTDRSRLLTAMRMANGGQFVSGPTDSGDVSLIVPGVPRSYSAYRIGLGGLQPLRSPRATGGTRLTLEKFSTTGLVVLTEDPLAISNLTRGLAQTRRRAASRSVEVAELTLESLKRAHGVLGGHSKSATQVDVYIRQARESLRRAQGLLKSEELEGAQAYADFAIRAATMGQRAYWQDAPASYGSPVTNPYRVTFATLPLSWTLADRIKSSRPGQNLLVGGEFEHLDYMVRTGWRHLRHHSYDLTSEVDLSPNRPHSGRYALRLRATSVDTKTKERVVESPPVWIHSAPVPVQRGQLLQIHGWVNIVKPIRGSTDGLLIYDSLGGPALGSRLRVTGGWQPFLLYRAADRDTQLTLTFALSGIGEALIDDVTIAPITVQYQPPSAPIPGIATPPSLDQARRLQGMFAPPR